MLQKPEELPNPSARDEEANSLRRIVEALQGLRFGEVTVVVQDGVVVQVERTERVRVRNGSRR
jgi:hypothetical protein